MKIVNIKSSLIMTAMIVFVSLLVPFVAVAKEVQVQQSNNNDNGKSSNVVNQNSGAESTEPKPNAVATLTTRATTGKLEATKLKLCQNRERTTANIMARIADRGNKQMLVFDKISERVQAFYKSKGYSLGNYDELLAQVNTTRAGVQTATQTITQHGVDFNCDSDDPKGSVNAFKERARVQNEDMKAYKTAINNLIVGVKSVASEVGVQKNEN